MTKRIAFCLAAIMLAVTMLSICAFADYGDIEDKPYEFNFVNGYTQVSAPRYKYDKTAVYMNCSYSNYDWSVAPGAYSIYAGYVGQWGTAYTVHTGSERWMINSIRENGWEYANLIGTPVSAASYIAKGEWSPDSV